MKTFNPLLSLLFLLVSVSCLAQSIHSPTISSGGTFKQSGMINLGYTVGQVSASTLTATAASISTGFQQGTAEPVIITENKALQLNNISPQIFPIPATDYLTIIYTNPYEYRLLDSAGKECLRGATTGTEELDLIDLKPGIYQLVLYPRTDLLKHHILKIIKSN